MGKIKVLVVDDNKALVSMILEYFKDNKSIEIVDYAYDGLEGFEKIKKNNSKYDLVLLDLIMPKKDGLYVLNQMKDNNIKNKVIVATSYGSGEIVRETTSLGISFFILKPYELIDLEKRMLECNNKKINFNSQDIQISISKTLHDLGIPSHIKGYQYIRDAITIVFNKPDTIGGITKELYPELANRYNTSVSRVERAIRHAIEVSWNRGDWDLMDEIFGHSVDIDKAKPTNSEFIVTLADKLSLDSKVRV